MPRSFLFVPGDSEKKIAKGWDVGADALIFDLEDAVTAARRPAAHAMVLEALGRPRADADSERWVRVNPLDTVAALEDLAAILRGAPEGIIVPKIQAAADLVTLDHMLTALEVREGLGRGTTRFLPVATETPQIMFDLGNLATVGDRLAGVTWGGEDLSAAMGATRSRVADGWAFSYQVARTFCLFAAHAASVEAIDTLYADFTDDEGLKVSAQGARMDGFSGMIAIHPRQVPIINEAFTPSTEETDYAARVIEAFEQGGGAGAVSLDGKMLDMPHLKLARRVLEQR